MRVAELQTPELDLSPKDTVRSPGLHVSGIIRDLENTLTPGLRRPYDDLSPAERARMGNYTAMGWAFEVMVRQALVQAGVGKLMQEAGYITVGEMEQEGVFATPDWMDAVNWRIVEFKATWRSSRRPLEPDFWHWMVQIKAYCHMVQCTEADLYAFFVCGDYRDSGPQFKGWRLSFTNLEIAENWQMLMLHKRAMERRKDKADGTSDGSGKQGRHSK